MTTIDTCNITVTLEPLTQEGFAAFGDVASRPSGARRRYLPTSVNCADEARTFSLWISSAAAVVSLPLRLATLERHPFTAQTFVPLDAGRYLVIVCAAAPDGQPDLNHLRGFVAQSHQSVTFARNVWHHPSAALDRHMEFAVAMAMTGRNDDDVSVSLDAAVDVVSPLESC
ncbi:ureidoglycolate lyase [soil metagenome]